MENIFSNAKWGDIFKTYNNRKCIFLGSLFDGFYICTIENEPFTMEYNIDGTLKGALRKNWKEYYHPLDVVGKWEEPLDEKKLSHLAIEASNKRRELFTRRYEGTGISMSNFSLGDMDDAYMDGYDAGYRKAKEENQ